MKTPHPKQRGAGGKRGRAKPSRHPQPISNTAWYYEYPGSIIVVVEHRTPTGEYVQTTQTRIRWSKLMKSAARCGRVSPHGQAAR